jgi:hypothetical protein
LPSHARYSARNVGTIAANISPSRRLDRRFSVRSVTCMHTLLRHVLRTLTLMDTGARGMGELGHGQERVGRPSLAVSIVGSRCCLPRAYNHKAIPKFVSSLCPGVYLYTVPLNDELLRVLVFMKKKISLEKKKRVFLCCVYGTTVKSFATERIPHENARRP